MTRAGLETVFSGLTCQDLYLYLSFQMLLKCMTTLPSNTSKSGRQRLIKLMQQITAKNMMFQKVFASSSLLYFSYRALKLLFTKTTINNNFFDVSDTLPSDLLLWSIKAFDMK